METIDWLSEGKMWPRVPGAPQGLNLAPGGTFAASWPALADQCEQDVCASPGPRATRPWGVNISTTVVLEVSRSRREAGKLKAVQSSAVEEVMSLPVSSILLL